MASPTLGEIRAVDSDQSTRVKVRVIAATHRDLRREVSDGRFREELDYGIDVVELQVPLSASGSKLSRTA